MRVEPGFTDSDAGRAILLRYRRRVWLWTAVVSAIYFSGSWKLNSTGALSLWLGPIWFATGIGCTVMWALASRETKLEATQISEPAVRTADLFSESGVTNRWIASLDWLGIVVPFAIPAAATYVVISHWRQMPSTWPWHHLWPIFFAAVFGVIPAGTQFALHYHTRSSDWNPDPAESQKYRMLVGLPQVLVFSFISLQMCVMATMPLAPFQTMDRYFSFTFRGYAILFLVLFGIKWWLRKSVSRQSSDPMPDNSWKWGFYYVNPDDPAFVVPARSGTGFCFNYGRRTVRIAWGVVIAIIAIDLVWTFGMLLSFRHQ